MIMFLPINKQDMSERGWHYVDFVYVSGDAYVDHPSFGAAIISRTLEKAGFKVGFLSQPDWKNKESIKVFGKPRYGFFVSSGNIDSMVAHYTVAKRKRNEDLYSPGGIAGKRPDRAEDLLIMIIGQMKFFRLFLFLQQQISFLTVWEKNKLFRLQKL